MRKIQNADLHRLSTADFKQAGKMPFAILLDDVRSMNNTGSVFRTADAFLCSTIALCGITAVPPHREIHKSALGAEETVDWFYEKSAADAIMLFRKEDYSIVAIEQVEGAIPLDKMKFDPQKKYLFIFGNEITGVSDGALSLCDLAIEIPQFGTKHSLNISVSAGIIAYAYTASLIK